MIEKTGDLFTTTAKAIAHGCNTQGLMGAGVAAIVREQFPYTYEYYNQLCKAEVIDPGMCFPSYENGKWVFNMMTQEKAGANARLDLIEESGEEAAGQAHQLGISVIAIPRIGCGIGGLTWEQVGPVLRQIERDANSELDFEFQWEVWTPA